MCNTYMHTYGRPCRNLNFCRETLIFFSFKKLNVLNIHLVPKLLFCIPSIDTFFSSFSQINVIGLLKVKINK